MIRPVPAGPVEDGIVQLPEHAGIVVLYRAVHQGIQRPAHPVFPIVDGPGIVGIPNGLDILHPGAEDIVVLLPRLSHDLDIGPVIGAQGHRAVEHELHVARAAGLGTRRGDLLGYVRRGNDMLRIGAIVVLHKDHPQLILYRRIVVDQLGDLVDILDDALRPGIAGGRLGPEDKGRGRKIL